MKRRVKSAPSSIKILLPIVTFLSAGFVFLLSQSPVEGCGGRCPSPTLSPTPTPEEPVYHSECVKNACVQVEGEGEDLCESDKQCEAPLSPTPTESPTPTPTESVTPTPTNEPSRGGNGGGPVPAPVCTDTTPSAPVLLSVTKQPGGSVLVKWQKVTPANHYSILYGPTSGSYPYSVFDTGNVDTFEVGGMASGCFAVKAANGCAPGPLSNEICTSGVGGQVLGASTMAGTGTSTEIFQYAIFFLGSVIAGLGVRKLSPKAI